MKINLTIKAALAGLVALGAANAAQRVDIHPTHKRLSHVDAMKEASKLKQMVDHPTPAMVAGAFPRLGAHANTMDLMALTENAITIDQYVTNAKARLIAHLDAWVDTDLLNPDGAFLHNAGVANGVAPLALSNLNRPNGTPYVPGATPADLTRNGFKAAYAAHINAIARAELAHANPDIVRPADGSIEAVALVNTAFKTEMSAELSAWVDALMNPGGNHQLLSGLVGNTGAGGHGAAVIIVGGNAARAPAGWNRDEFVAMLQAVVAERTY